MAKEENENTPPKKGKTKIILLILILLLLCAGGATTYWWFQMREPAEAKAPTDTTSSTSNSNAQQDEVNASSADSEKQGVTSQSTQTPAGQTVVNLVNIPTVTVNLVDKDPVRYLRVGMDVEVNTKEAINTLNSQIARVRDSIIIILSGKTYSELATTAGKLSIKNDIILRLNQILGAPQVVQIYFTEFVIQ